VFEMIEATFICNHCKKRESMLSVNDVNVTLFMRESYDIVYIPKNWFNLGKNKHLCKKCAEKLSKTQKEFLESVR